MSLKLRHLLLVGLLLIGTNGWSQGSLHLLMGQSYSSTFSTVPFSFAGALVEPSAAGLFHFATPSLTPGNEIYLELFEGGLNEAPIATGFFNTWGEQAQIRVLGAWQDLQGAMRITVTSGTADLSGLEVNVFKGAAFSGDAYGLGQIMPVPEPSSMWICISGFAVATCLFKSRRCKKY